MKNQFVPYELAVKLKELGFDEECFGYYNAKGSIRHIGQIEPLGLDTEEMSNDILNSKYCSAPLWQQAFDWFRESHGLYAILHKSLDGYFIEIIRVTYFASELYEDQLPYEEARPSCLEKLIEIDSCKYEK